MGDDLPEAVSNLRTLLSQDPKRFGPMVERQVQFALIPRLAGPRADLEQPLWSLLVLLLEGHEAPVPAVDESAWERMHEQASGNGAQFPRAARAVAAVVATLREHGTYPPPRMPSGESEAESP